MPGDRDEFNPDTNIFVLSWCRDSGTLQRYVPKWLIAAEQGLDASSLSDTRPAQPITTHIIRGDPRGAIDRDQRRRHAGEPRLAGG
jgi:hypothetical protein